MTAIALVLLGMLAGTLTIGTPAHAAGEPSDRVVLIGVPGLRWGDVKPKATPVMWRLAGEGAIANIAVRGVAPLSCPADGWLTISAGSRAQPIDGDCALLPAPRRDGSGAFVPDFGELRAHNAGTTYAARVGLLGDVLNGIGGCTAAVGRGGALAAADSSGHVDYYRSSVAKMPHRGWTRCPLTVVDVDDIARTPGERTAALARVDDQVDKVLSQVPVDTTIVLVGVADLQDPGLRVAVTAWRGDETRRKAIYLTAPSTRRPGLVTLTDVTPTVLRLAGAPVPTELSGSPWERGAARPARQSAAVKALQDRDLAARITRALVAPFNVALVGGQLIAYVLAALAWQRRRARRRTVLAVTRYVALAAATAPAATYLANLVPWWSVQHPSGGLIAGVIAADLAVLAVAMSGPWRRHPLGPVTVVAAVTALSLAADAIAGSHLQADSLNGNFSLVAGRFYGFGNLTFALFATASLICAAGLAGPALAAGHRRRALLPVLLIGAAAIVIDGWPGWGSDFGGVLALTPGVVLLAMWITGVRVSPQRMAVAGAAGALIVSALAYVDYRRPADQRTHFGDFGQQLLDGQALAVVARKADSMLHSLGSVWLTLLVPLPLLILAFVALRADGRLSSLFQEAPGLRAGLLAVLITAIIGFAVNDSGIAVLALSALIAIPLTLAAALSTLERRLGVPDLDDGAV
ncbi:hypothetical protein [Actinomadura sp. HBU206391]|uniref:hypothetical protein n=1 Tax=Actinomadura sp. HBU206391 TaxID=2731692 RepID=UPI00165007F8|nr:hypothetical protein [Actinomadura sp. HBU206391]MBC6462311.1 hypothetical protein [Actinomadura sp. HBU206391]